jgi:3-dehydroquinate dehydratase-2
MRILVINGPNLQMLGQREPGIYGDATLSDLESMIAAESQALGCQVECRQSNHEGDLVDWIAEASGSFDGIVINPAAYTHTSIAIRDAVSASKLPVVEVHISNVHAREQFRHHSMVAPVCHGQICGLGFTGYLLAMRALVSENA